MHLRFIDECRPVTPGQTIDLDLVVTNDGVDDLGDLRIRAIGLGSMVADHAVLLEGVPAGAFVRARLRVQVPKGQAPGRHRFGAEVTDGHGRTATASTTLAISSAGDVLLLLTPSTVRGFHRGRFTAEVVNRGAEPVVLSVHGESDHLDIDLPTDRFELGPGGEVVLDGRVTARHRKLQPGADRLFAVVAQGHSTPIRETAVFVHRDVLPRLGKTVAVVAAMSLWLIGMVAGLQWMDQRILNDLRAEAGIEVAGEPATTVGTEDDGSDGAGAGTGLDEDDGGDEAEGDAEAPPDELAFADEPVTEVGGVVTITSGEDATGVVVSLRSVALDPGDDRSGEVVPGGGADPATSTETGADGAWLIPEVAVPGRYEVRFDKPGYRTESRYVGLGADDGPLELEVDLASIPGRLGGIVTAGGAPMGGATVTVAGGSIDHSTTTDTEGQVGAWSVAGLETPGRYLVTVERRGYRTETQTFDLEAGESIDTISTRLSSSVGSISGMIRHDGEPVGGVTVVAVGGDVTRTTSSLTEGDVGRFLLPQIPTPGSYTLTVSGLGFEPQTLAVAQPGDGAELTIDLVSASAGIRGVVTDNDGVALGDVDIHATDGSRSYRTSTAMDPIGSFELDGLGIGDHVVSFEATGYQTSSSLVTLEPGRSVTLNPQLNPQLTPVD